MRRFAVRQRPLQPGKRIRIYHLAVDGSFINENGDRVAANAYELDDCVSVVLNGCAASSKRAVRFPQIAALFLLGGKPFLGRKAAAIPPSPEKTSFLTKARISIPKPPIRTIPNYDSEVSHTFKRSNGFIKYIPLTLEEEANRVEYNLDANDEMWLRKHKLYGDAAAESKRISLDLFERMIDCTEKYCGEHHAEPTAVGVDAFDDSQDILETLFIQKLQFNRVDSHEVCKHVLEYWKRKRKELGKPLLRRYWPLTNVNDSNPNLVFRPRGKDEHYRLRKKTKPNEELVERMVELRGNLEEARTLCQLTHQREQLKLKKLLYICETVVEVHYLLTKHSGARPLTYNLKDMFVYEGRTSSILSATSSANAYATFNPVASHGFGVDSRFGMNTLTEEMDEITALTTSSSLSHVTSEEKQYLQLLALAQLGGVFDGASFVRCATPALVINQAGSTETTGANWLLPVEARDSYTQFACDSIDVGTYSLEKASPLPRRTRLRGRVGRGGRVWIDRLSERKPLFGNVTHEVYRGDLPMAAVRYTPRGKTEETTNPLVPPLEFNRHLPERLGVKRAYQEVAPNESAISYCNMDASMSFNLASEMMVRVDTVKRLLLTRNTSNDQIQFFL